MEEDPEFHTDDGSGIAKPMWEIAKFFLHVLNSLFELQLKCHPAYPSKVGLSSVFESQQPNH